MAKHQKDDDYLSKRVRGVTLQRSYEYDTTDYNEDTGEKERKPNAPTEEEWREQILNDWGNEAVKSEFGYLIFHDRDKMANGDPKPLHVHMVIKFKNPRTIGSLQKKFGVSRTENISQVKSYKGSLNYLLHITKKARQDHKYVYAQDELYAFGSEIDDSDRHRHFNEMTTGSSSDEDQDAKEEITKAVQEFVADIEQNGTMPVIDSFYDEFTEHRALVTDVFNTYYHKMLTSERRHYEAKARDAIRNGRRLTNIYISGKGGTGKSTLAEWLGLRLADDRGVHMAAPKSEGKTYDPCDNYNYEKVSIFNEMHSNLFNPRELMANFDNHKYTPISSRNKNANWLAEYALFTSSDSVEKFRDETLIYSKGGSDLGVENSQYDSGVKLYDKGDAKDLAYQVARRFTHNIEIQQLKGDKKLISVFEFQDEVGYSVLHPDYDPFDLSLGPDYSPQYYTHTCGPGYVLQIQIIVSGNFYLNESEMRKIISVIDNCVRVRLDDNGDVLEKPKIKRAPIKVDKNLLQDSGTRVSDERYRVPSSYRFFERADGVRCCTGSQVGKRDVFACIDVEDLPESMN